MTDAVPRLFDRAALAARRRAVIARADPGAAFLVDLVADDLADRLAAVSRSFADAAVIGGPTDALAAAVGRSGRADVVWRADLFAAGPAGRHPADLVLDDAALPFAPGSLDLIVSGLTLHWVDDLPGTLMQLRRALRPDGLLLATLVGGDSLTELREAITLAEVELYGGVSPRVAPMAEVRDLGGLMQRAGFALPVADQDRLTLRYATPFHLMRDLKAMGAGNILAERKRGLTGARLIARAAEIYAERYADDDGRVPATITLVSLSGWAPHESQQQPLRPGSAKTRLADALGTTEVRLKGD
ncbi:methyltransferase domain-containing protein [Methylobrevis albus]|uniref:Methyltransferase domain-containing protein n=1 Tax=Methylobrevis albus TaxID=2793297 RepID=A0A931I114_9HYPH|nr:methyltransferase domain-containing protein [Methylobrevis albus]MBH0237350.1 methyltransferase domain-containing protein [Methylobrevis albus]